MPERTKDRKFWFARVKNGTLGHYRGGPRVHICCSCAVEDKADLKAYPGIKGAHCKCGKDQWRAALQEERDEFQRRQEKAMKESDYVPPKRKPPRDKFLEANPKPAEADLKPIKSAAGQQQQAIATLARVAAQALSTASKKSSHLRPPPSHRTPKKPTKTVAKTPQLPPAAQPCGISPPPQAMPVPQVPLAKLGTAPKDDDSPTLPRPRGRKRQRHEDGLPKPIEQVPKNSCVSLIRLNDRGNDPLLSEQADADTQPFQPWHAANVIPAKPTLQRVSTLGGYDDASLGGCKAVPDDLDLLYQGDVHDVYYDPEKQRGRAERQILPVIELQDLPVDADILDVCVDLVDEVDFEQWAA